MHPYMYAMQKVNSILQRKWLRYLVVGGATGSLDYGIFSLLYLVLGVWYVYATMIASSVVWVLNFSLHKLWTFKDSSRKAVTGGQAAIHVSLKAYNGYLLVPYLLYLFAEHYGVSPLIGKLAAAVFVAVQNFTLYYFVIFNPRLRGFLCRLLAR